jgi:hypothetical protein
VSCREETVAFGGSSRHLRGILARPAAARAGGDWAVLMAGAGMIHSVGPNRFYVRAARTLAEAGAPSLRFDAAGIGDSDWSDQMSSPEERILSEAQAGIDLLRERTGATRIVVLGLCSGAVTAFRVALAQPSVRAAVLINPDTSRVDERVQRHLTERTTLRHYLGTALRDRRSWRRLLTGRSHYRELARVPAMIWRHLAAGRRVSVDEAAARELIALVVRPVRVLVISGSRDHSAEYLRLVQSRLSPGARPYLTAEILTAGDHTLSCWRHQEQALARLRSWTEALA